MIEIQHYLLTFGITLLAGYIAGSPNRLTRNRYTTATLGGLAIGIIWTIAILITRSRVVAGIHGPESGLFYGASWLVDSLLLTSGAVAGSLAAALTPDDLFVKRWLGGYDQPKHNDENDSQNEK